MAQTKITTTSSEGLKPLGQEGQRSYEMITTLVGSRLGGEYALLFAEPVTSPGGAETDWYVQSEGPAKRLEDLSDADQEALKLRLAEMVENIDQFASELAQKGGDSNERVSEALRNAVEVPSERSVYAVQNAMGALLPVLVDWASVREDQKLFRGALSEIVQKKPAALPDASAAASISQHISQNLTKPSLAGVKATTLWFLPWLLWTILATVLITTATLLVAPCGLRGLESISFCPVSAKFEAYDPLAEQRVLLDRITSLQLAIINTERDCSNQQAPGPTVDHSAVPAPQNQGDPAIESRLDSQQGQRGDMNVSLVWDTVSDLDLAVTCPNGTIISFRNRTPAQCPGRLDVDANVSRLNATTQPIENVFFENPSAGTYQISVNLFSRNGISGDLPFTVQVRLGDSIRLFTGTVGNSINSWQNSFEYEAH